MPKYIVSIYTFSRQEQTVEAERAEQASSIAHGNPQNYITVLSGRNKEVFKQEDVVHPQKENEYPERSEVDLKKEVTKVNKEIEKDQIDMSGAAGAIPKEPPDA